MLPLSKNKYIYKRVIVFHICIHAYKFIDKFHLHNRLKIDMYL